MTYQSAAPKYSVCIINYNTGRTIRESLDSILDQIDESFEVVVCDNCSTDESREVLEEYAAKKKIKLIVEKCGRGRGRQIAFENSKGDYILSGFDMDDVFKPTLRAVLETYHKDHEGYMVTFESLYIIPRAIVEEVGGWRDLPYYEDLDFIKRVESISKVHYFNDASLLVLKRGSYEEKSKTWGLLHRLRERYLDDQSMYIIGDNPLKLKHAKYAWYTRKALFIFHGITLAIFKARRTQRLSTKPYTPPHPYPSAFQISDPS